MCNQIKNVNEIIHTVYISVVMSIACLPCAVCSDSNLSWDVWVAWVCTNCTEFIYYQSLGYGWGCLSEPKQQDILDI